MAATFDYTARLRNGFLLSHPLSTGKYLSQNSTINSVFNEVFRALFNPGHQNNSSAFEYTLRPYFGFSGSSYKWQFQENGSTVWVTFSTGIAAVNAVSLRTGTYETSAVALPMSIKLMSKTSSAGYVWITNKSSNSCSIRSWGPIST